MLRPLERKHLGDEQVQDVGLDPSAVLQRAGQIHWELAPGQGLALGTRLDLCVHVAHHLLEDDIDSGASFVPLAGGAAEVFATGPALGDRSDLDGLNGAGVAGQDIVL